MDPQIVERPLEGLDRLEVRRVVSHEEVVQRILGVGREFDRVVLAPPVSGDLETKLILQLLARPQHVAQSVDDHFQDGAETGRQLPRDRHAFQSRGGQQRGEVKLATSRRRDRRRRNRSARHGWRRRRWRSRSHGQRCRRGSGAARGHRRRWCGSLRRRRRRAPQRWRLSRTRRPWSGAPTVRSRCSRRRPRRRGRRRRLRGRALEVRVRERIVVGRNRRGWPRLDGRHRRQNLLRGRSARGRDPRQLEIGAQR